MSDDATDWQENGWQENTDEKFIDRTAVFLIFLVMGTALIETWIEGEYWNLS